VALHFDHVNITVASIDRAAEFLKIAFPHFERRGGGEGQSEGMRVAWSHLGTEEEYVSLNETSAVQRTERNGSRESGINHVGFVVFDLARLQARYEAAGHKCQPIDERPSRLRLYVTDHDNIMWEFIQYLSDDPAVQNDYSI
jgi:catechol 2,3-dioxygenase-like lactoylglutathione lyase family enzyme